MKDHRHVFQFLNLILIVLFLLAGCSSSDPTPVSLDGYVSAKADVSAVSLQVTDAGGYVLAEKAPATGDSGIFMVTVNGLPDEFRVISSGGADDGQSVDYKLMAQFKGFNPGKDRIYVNLATTLVCVYLDRNRDKSLPEAVSIVKAFLAIPAEVDIGEGLYHNDKYFSPRTFLKEAETKGGVESFMKTLVDEMAEDAGAKHAFLRPPGLRDGGPGGALAGCAGTTMAQAARNGLIAWGVGFAMNKGMEALFPGTGAPTKADIAELKYMLIDIQVQLTQLGNAVASAKNELKAEILKSEYNIGSMQLADYITVVENTFKDLKNELMKDPDTLTEQEKKERLNTINLKLKTIEDKIEPYLGSLHRKLYGEGGTGAQGLYKIYADLLKTQKRFLTKQNYTDKVKYLFLYYNQIQATALYLAVEYYHAKEMSKTIVDTHTEQLGTDSQAELDWFNSKKPMFSTDLYIFHADKYNLMIYLPDNHYQTMLASNPPVFIGHLQGYNFQTFSGGMTEKIDHGIGFILQMIWDRRYGFVNWRFPLIDEMNDMFRDWSGSSAGQFALSQGLTPMNRERFLPVFQDPATCSDTIDCVWIWASKHYEDTHYGFFYYKTTAGNYGWSPWQTKNSFHHMPVRLMQPAESAQYFW